MERYRCDNMYNSLEELLQKEKRLDAVALFTPPPQHVQARRNVHAAGACTSIRAVPACFTLEEAEKLRALKEKTGLALHDGRDQLLSSRLYLRAQATREPAASANFSTANWCIITIAAICRNS